MSFPAQELHPVELINPRELRKAQEQLERLGNYWIGPDVKTDKAIVMPPSAIAVDEVRLCVSKRDLPPVNVTREMLTMMNWSTRSRLAQVGIELDFDPLSVTDEMIRDMGDGKDVPLPVWVKNYSSRPVVLEGNVMRFFWTSETNRLRGDALREVIASGDFAVDGDNWTINENESCVRLPIEHKFYIPASREIIRIREKGDLSTILQAIPNDQDPDFKIGETAQVRLGPDIVGVINWGMYDRGEVHTRSPLIDPGFEGSIRTETLRGLKVIELFLYRK